MPLLQYYYSDDATPVHVGYHYCNSNNNNSAIIGTI